MRRRGLAVSRREITFPRFASPGRFVAAASLSFASWPRYFFEFIGPIGHEANSRNKNSSTMPRNGEQNFARLWGPGFDAPLSLFLSSGPSSFPSGIVEENPLFVAGCRTSRQRFFRIASKQRRTRSSRGPRDFIRRVDVAPVLSVSTSLAFSFNRLCTVDRRNI